MHVFDFGFPFTHLILKSDFRIVFSSDFNFIDKFSEIKVIHRFVKQKKKKITHHCKEHWSNFLLRDRVQYNND